MANGLSGVNLKSLGVLWDLGTCSGLDDGELLSRFVEGRLSSSEVAFEVLVRRHGPMVLGVCRSLLVDRHAAEDAFQAVFLVLARKARSIRRPEQLGPWLHGVALRTARESRKREGRRRRLERRVANMQSAPSIPPDQALLRLEEAENLHREIARLPERYRAVIVVCDLEGLTQQEASSRLRCPVGTVAIRLKRARERLRTRLTRRGLAPLSGPVLTYPRTEITPALIDATVKASLASGFAAASVVSLAQGVSMTMSIAKWKTTSASLILALGLAATWAAAGGRAGPEPDDPPPPVPQKNAGQPAALEPGEVLYFNGRIESLRSVRLHSRVIGVLKNVLVEQGSRFKANDVLFEINPKPYEKALKAAQNETEKARAEDDLAATKIKAPFAGVVFGPVAQLGDLIRPNETLLTTVVATDLIGVAFDVDERTILKIRRLYGDDEKALDRLDVRVGLAGKGDFPHRAFLKSLPSRIDPVTGTARFHSTVPNPDQILTLGSFVRVRLTLNDSKSPPAGPRAVLKDDEPTPAKAAASGPKSSPDRAVARVVTREIRDYEEFAGRVEAFRGKIQSEVGGTIATAFFPDGGPVKDKAVLFEIDASRPMDELKAEIETLKAKLPDLKAEADAAAEAFKKLEARRASNPQVAKEEQDEYDQAAVKNQQARTAVSTANRGIEFLLSELQSIPSHAQVRATFDGILDRPLVKVGDPLEPKQTILANFEATDRMSVSFDVPKPMIRQINLNEWFKDEIVLFDNAAQVTVAEVNPFPLRAQVEHSPMVIDPATGAYRLKATIRDRDRIVLPGMEATVRLPIGRFHDALLVPEAAIISDSTRKQVYVLDDRDTIEVRSVQLGLLHDGYREIREGLKAGERVVVEDLASLKAGMTIRPRAASKPGR